jgi:hypothetical protein
MISISRVAVSCNRLFMLSTNVDNIGGRDASCNTSIGVHCVIDSTNGKQSYSGGVATISLMTSSTSSIWSSGASSVPCLDL